VAEARGETPSLSRLTICSRSHWLTPASCGEASDGAYQFCIGIKPPARSRSSAWLLAPSALRAVWQALQWPGPLTR